jgi:hypothetical protein
MPRRSILVAFGALTLAVPAASGEAVRGWIQTERSGGTVNFIGFAQANVAGEIRYELKVTKEGKSGRTNAQQAGRVRLSGSAPRRLAQSSVNIGQGDDYCVQLAIYQGGQLVVRQIVTAAGETGSC